MFYEDAAESGLRYDPFKAIVAPRPIGWIGTLNEKGIPNLGPYSFFNAVSSRPNIVMFSSADWKHSVKNAAHHREFTVSLATHALKDAMNVSSGHWDDGDDEFARAGLARGTPRVVKAPFVEASPAALECKVISIDEVKGLDGVGTNHFLVLGQVVGVHIDDAYLADGKFDGNKAQAIARCGYKDYATAGVLWELDRPDGPAVPV